MSPNSQIEQMMNRLPCGIGLFEDAPEGRLLFLNDACYTLIGYTREEYAAISERPFSSFLHPDDRWIYEANKRQIESGQSVTDCEYRIVSPDGSTRWVKLDLSHIELDGQRVVFATFADITKEMQKAAIQQELIDAMPGSVAVFRVEQPIRCLYYNAAHSIRNQHTQQAFQEIFDSERVLDQLVAPPDRQRFQTEVLDKVHAGLPVNVTYRYIRDPDEHHGHFDWVHLTAQKIREDNGHPVYYAVMTAPPQENMLYRSIVEDSLTAVLVTEKASGSILYANQAFQMLIGHGATMQLAGKPLEQAIAPKMAREFQRQSDTLSEDAFQESTLCDDSGRCYLVKGRQLFWNGIDACLFYLLDQTELAKRNDALMKLLDDIPGGIGIFEQADGHLKQLYLNQGFFRLLGTTRERMRGFDANMHESLIHPDDIALFSSMTQEQLAHDSRVNITYRIRHSSGDYRWFRLIGNVNCLADGQTVIYCSYFDVDDQVNAQLALSNERMLLHLAIQSAKLSTWEYDQSTRKLVQSNETSELSSMPDVIEDVPESLIRIGFVHPDDAQKFRELYDTPADPESATVQAEIRIRQGRDAQYQWHRTVLTHLFDEEGRYLKTIGTSLNITREKEAEEAYQRQLHGLINANEPDLIAKGQANLTQNRNEMFVAKSEPTIPGLDITEHDEMIRQIAASIAQPDQAAQFQEMFDRQHLIDEFRRGNASTSFEYQRTTEDGTTSWVRMYWTLSFEPSSGDVIGFVYAYDISDEVLTRELLDTIVRLDYDFFALIDCDDNSYQLYGKAAPGHSPLPPPEGVDYEQCVREYNRRYVVPDEVDRSIVNMSIENVRAQLVHHETYVFSVTMIEPDASLSRKKIQFSYIDRANGKMLITRTDISALFAQEQQHLDELKVAVEAARKANGVKTEFLSHMSHDLRTPMNVIIGLSELAQDELDDPQAMGAYVDNIRSAGQFLLGLVNDCLDYEKLSEHKMRLHPVPYPYEEFRDSITMMIEPLCAQKGISFSFSQAAPYTVCIDKVRFEQIFFNLLSNSVKYTPAGGHIAFTAKSHLNSDGSLVICDFFVCDDGIGMTDDFQKHLYEPFEQENADLHASRQGTGLGLSIVKELVELMGGTIHVRSTQGKDTEVMVHLDMPNITDADEAESHDVAPSVVHLAGRTILLVEDQPLNMLIAKRLLENQGMQVVGAEDGQQGLEKFESSEVGSFAAVLTDIRMPIMDGLATARAIRALPRADARTVPIVAMTANAFDEDIQKSYDAGMNAHLSKPIDPAQLYRTLENLIAPEADNGSG